MHDQAEDRTHSIGQRDAVTAWYLLAAGSIDEQMAAKGFTKAEANPDVFVVYHMAFDKQQDISTYSSGYGGGYGAYGWGWGGGFGASGTSTTQVRDILIGTLVVDLADAKKVRVHGLTPSMSTPGTAAAPDDNAATLSILESVLNGISSL